MTWSRRSRIACRFDHRDAPSQAFIDELRTKHPTEREVDKMLTRKMQRRGSPPYQRPSLDDIAKRLDTYLHHAFAADRVPKPNGFPSRR